MSCLPKGKVAVILPAAGSGQRFGASENKLFSDLAGEPLWVHSVRRLGCRSEVGRVILAVANQDLATFRAQLSDYDLGCSVDIVEGGAERVDSVKAAMSLLDTDASLEWVAVHDAARPLISQADLDRVFSAVAKTGAAILASPVSGTLKRDFGDRQCRETVDRRNLWVALTPQVFRLGLLKQAYAKHNGCPATDDAQLVERLGYEITLVHGSATNLKVTFPEDLLLAEAIKKKKK